MTESQTLECLAVDGGGTRSRFALAAAGDPIVVTAGPANVSTDFAGSVQTILSGIGKLAEETGRPVDDLTGLPAFIGLAGVTGTALTERLFEALPFRTVRYADDRLAALHGALGSGDGVIAHCGTGSFIAGRIGGRERLAGGWGPVLGDEGSAQVLGRRLLWLVLQHADGFRPSSPLLAETLDRFGDAAEIVRFAGSARPPELGALAPMVTEAAASGDPAAQFLMREAAEIVADELRKLGWVPGLPICLTGGVGPTYAAYLPEEMRKDIREPLEEPIGGAIALARDLAREHAT